MKKHTSSRSGLLLMEIIIAILFFSVVSAICLQLFVKSHNLGRDTEELDMAVRQASSVAEILSRFEDPAEELEAVYPDSSIEKDGGFIYFDKDFQTCNAKSSYYHIKITASADNDRLTNYEITVYAGDDDTDNEIYRLDAAAYRQLSPDAALH